MCLSISISSGLFADDKLSTHKGYMLKANFKSKVNFITKHFDVIIIIQIAAFWVFC